VIPVKVCFSFYLIKTFVCAALKMFSGGPLLVNNVQIGIVSWSVKPCGIPPFPGVFTGWHIEKHFE
jgi:secreted trypsin-like serine protease